MQLSDFENNEEIICNVQSKFGQFNWSKVKWRHVKKDGGSNYVYALHGGVIL